MAKEFIERKIVNSTANAKVSGIDVLDNRVHDDNYIQQDSAIVYKLSRQEYLGHRVTSKPIARPVCRKRMNVKNVRYSRMPTKQLLRSLHYR